VGRGGSQCVAGDKKDWAVIPAVWHAKNVPSISRRGRGGGEGGKRVFIPRSDQGNNSEGLKELGRERRQSSTRLSEICSSLPLGAQGEGGIERVACPPIENEACLTRRTNATLKGNSTLRKDGGKLKPGGNSLRKERLSLLEGEQSSTHRGRKQAVLEVLRAGGTLHASPVRDVSSISTQEEVLKGSLPTSVSGVCPSR